MEFNKAYNRNELIKFLRTTFLPEDFIQEETTLANPKQFQYTQQVTRLGECKSLELVVFEVMHTSVSDARVGLTKEAFRMLADEFCERALVFFVPQDDNSNYRFSLIEITLEQKEGSAKVQRTFSNPHRYSYYLGEGISYHTPNKYLNEAGRVVSIEDLRSRFSVEVLTKAFYQELSDWYAWAVKVVRFPNVLDDKADNEAYNSEAMIRLITRLIFVWFIKQRHLVPDEFFDEKYISDHLLKSFTPNAKVTLFGKADNSYYYKGILQNLFFAMLNSPITPEGKDTVSERRFRKSRGDYDNNKLMRHEELFIDPKLFVELANKYVPFLNGGLFDCLDDKDNGKYFDAFTDREEIAKQLIVPDYLFFGEDVGRNIDLSEWYGDKRKKKVSARGIIDILKRYNFTVEENTPFDQDVSLDPELLGKVFENLLASYNPETQTTARKQTGSFYTPREIVQYMVDESLVAHLKRTVGDDLEAEYRKLIQYTDEEPNLTDEQRKAILQSIYQCKVLDPACGSGAFPMGMLQQMVHILNRIDPDNKEWKDMMVKNAISETSEAYLNATDDERKEIVADIERSFNENVNRPDYARKLYLIENCIYGVDIQPIAIQISKLRFFISLVVDQKTNDNPVDNFGIRPLPNLEAKFVAANTLIGLHNQTNLFVTDDIKQLQDEMKVAKHKIFGAKTVKTKRKYKDRVAQLRIQMVEELKRLRAVSDEDHLMLLDWDMFDQNKAAKFFDSNWMFGIDGGFDIVIGNPPYGVSIKGEYRKEVVRCLGNVPDYEIYYYFIQAGRNLLLENGTICYIIPNTWLFNTFARRFRETVLEKWNVIEILDCTKFKIFDATVLNSIITWQKKSTKQNKYIGYRCTSSSTSFSELISTSRVSMMKDDLINMNQNWGLAFYLPAKVSSLITKISKAPNSIISYFLCSQGYIPYRLSDLVTLYGKDEGNKIKENRLWHSPTKTNEYFIQEIYGRDITKYSYRATGDYVKYGTHVACYVDPIFFTSNRLLVREITNPSIIACLVSQEYINDPQLIPIISKTDNNQDLQYLWAILNSKLATFYHFNHSPKATKGAFPKILVQDIKEFPLPAVTESQKQTIIELVDKVLSAKKDNPQANTGAWETELDKLVYELYGLTEDEIKIIENIF
ncbi:MAG: N-6 DNA methylase [Bacteroidales bacterium]|nr:N-6 DNA methylase [Bacteroidales bacterium]